MSAPTTTTAAIPPATTDGDAQGLTAPAPKRQPTPLRRAPVDAPTSDEIAKAPDALRALRLGLEDCDAETLAGWIEFPLTVGDATYDDASQLAHACADGDAKALQPTTAALTQDLTKLAPDTTGALTLPIATSTWSLVWRKGQWWLSGIE